MDILNEKLLNSKIFSVLCKIMKNHYEIDPIKPVVSYDEFKVIVKKFIKEAMESIHAPKDTYGCEIKRMGMSYRANFDIEKDVITLNEDLVRKLYSGSLEELKTIFHELGHFMIKYAILDGVINPELIRIAKEKAIMHAPDIVVSKNKYSDDNCNPEYYCRNYVVESEEKVVEMNAYLTVISFAIIADINVSQKDMDRFRRLSLLNENMYHNYLRDFRVSSQFNDNWLNFDDAFDFLVKDNPSWLKNKEFTPQLSIEYYLDENGVVKKRSREELAELLKDERYKDLKECIEELIKGDDKKKSSKEYFTTRKSFGHFYSNNNINKSKCGTSRR